MKKIKLFSAIALTMVMASCDNYDLPNPDGQINPEPEAIFANSDLVLTQGTAVVNLTTYNQNNQDVTVAKISELKNFPADYALEIEMQLAGNDAMQNPVVVSTTIDGENVLVNPDILNGAIQAALTKEPGTYDIYANFVAYAVRQTTRVRLNGINGVYCPSTFEVTTLDPDKVMEQSYYFVNCAANGNPDYTTAVKMQNTLGNISVYDNPEFALKVEVDDAQAAAGFYWKILPASVVASKDNSQALGCYPSSTTGGKLGTEYGAGVIADAGEYLVTINVEVDSYTLSFAYDELYPVSGRANINNVMKLYTEDYITYSGVTAINQNLMLYGDPAKANAFSQNPDEEPVTDPETGTVSGLLYVGDSGQQIKAPVKANCLYWLNVNLVQLTYSLDALETLTVIGSGNGWDLETAVELKHSSDFKTWTASDVEIGDEFKINANRAWTISFSGNKVYDAEGELVYNVNKQDGGANLQATPGKYDVTVDFSTWPYVVTLKKK